MLEFLIFAIVAIVSLLIIVFVLYPGKPNVSCGVPGLEPWDEKTGNLGNLRDCGSLPEFLYDLHDKFGPVAGFFWGSSYVISVAAVEGFKQLASLFGKPGQLYEELLLPFLGEKSLLFSKNSSEARILQSKVDRAFDETRISTNYLPIINEIVAKLKTKFSQFESDKRLPLRQYMLAASSQCLCRVLFGKYFEEDEKLLDFVKNYDLCWTELEVRLNESDTNLDNMRMQTFEKAKSSLESQLTNIINSRANSEKRENSALFVDEIFDIHHTADEQSVSLCMDYLFYTYHPMCEILTWLFYFVTENPEVKQRICDEISTVSSELDNGFLSDYSQIQQLPYTQRVLKETLRVSSLIPWTAKISTVELKICEINIPKNTPIILASHAVCSDDRTFPDPQRFDPDRFEDEQLSRDFDLIQSPLIDFPSGNKKCPAEKLVYAVVFAFIVGLMPKFNFSFSDPEQMALLFYNSLVVRPEDEIFLHVSQIQ